MHTPESQGFLSALISLKVRARNEELSADEEVILIGEYLIAAAQSHDGVFPPALTDALYAYWAEYSDGEEWFYLGRDSNGEKMYRLLNPGCLEERTMRWFNQEWFAIAA